MADPCEPSSGLRHAHGPARIIGRIHRHGTSRLARQLHPGSGGCLPGKAPILVRKLLVQKLLGNAAAPVGLAVLAAAAPSIAASLSTGAGSGNSGGDPGITAPGPGRFPGGTGAPPPGQPGHHPPVSVGEPASLPLLLLGLLAMANMRKWLRPRAASRSRLGAAAGRS